MNQCQICGYPLKKYEKDHERPEFINYDCYKCGEYKLHEDAETELSKYTDEDKIYLSGWLVENQNIELDFQTIRKKKNYRRFSPAEKADKLLMALERVTKSFGANYYNLKIKIMKLETSKNHESFPEIGEVNKNNVNELLYLFTSSFAINYTEFDYLLNTFLKDYKNYLINKSDTASLLTISPEGWEHLEEIRFRNLESSIGFIAMRFTNDIIKFCDDYIYTAIKLAGYKPLRINDKDDLKESIDYEIAAAIRSSKFVIADFTYNSYGVYYEAGFARGYNIPIIYTCKDSDFHEKDKKPHFDVEHYPFIFWDQGTEKKFVKKLKAWIEATVGHGPLEFPEVQGFDLD